MTARLRPYPEYKDSGLPWIGKIPSHWKVRRLRDCGRITGGGTPSMSRAEYWGGTIPWVSPKDMKVWEIIETRDRITDTARRESGLRLLDPPTVLLVIRGMILARRVPVAVTQVPVTINQDMKALRPLPDISAKYVMYAIEAAQDALRELIDEAGHGTKRLPVERWRELEIWMPPIDEQRAIAAYLDDNAAQVRKFIRNRQRLIKVLNEQKQAIINHAVTRGLNPSDVHKPSGNDLLGDIPTHWEARPLRSLGRFMKGSGGSKDDDVAEGLPCIRYGHLYMYFDYIVPSARTFIDESRAHDYSRSRHGDILFTASGEDMAEIGKSAANLIDGEVCCGGDVIILRPRIDVDARFLGYASHAWHAACQKARLGRGTTIKHIYEDQLKNVWIAIPPRDEQAAIVAHIEKATADVEILIARAHDEIKLIREYRTRLIADVVTGKVDVRQFVTHEEQAERNASARENSESTERGRTANVHFKRAVFAAEIIHRLHEQPTFGHVKCEKLICLCEKCCGVDLGSTYHRQAAGPYDNRALRSIDSQIKKQKWYAAERDGQRYRYIALEKAGGHKTYFDRHFGAVEQEFTRIIDLFRTATTEQCEIVATVFVAWESLLDRGEDATDDRIVDEVLNHWHESKRRIQEARWRTAIRWMREKGLAPKAPRDQPDVLLETEA